MLQRSLYYDHCLLDEGTGSIYFTQRILMFEL